MQRTKLLIITDSNLFKDKLHKHLRKVLTNSKLEA